MNPPIFVVDDDPSVRKALLRLLGTAGYQVEAFSSAQSFLDSVPTDQQGCLVLDLRMPGMDGLQLQNRLIEFRSPLKIIFITAHAQADERETAMAKGAFGFLLKPFNDQSLLELIAATGT